MTHRLRNVIVLLAAAALGAVSVWAQQPQSVPTHDPGSHNQAGMMNGMGQAMMGRGMDAATMAQMGDIHEMFMAHERITRTVTNLPDGIRTVTESQDPRIAKILVAHVMSMNERVEKGDDPGLPIESEALRAIFKNHDKIRTTVEATATGIIVIQTSADQETVALLQQHASEVSKFVEEGMAAMHEAMMKNRGGMTGGSRDKAMPAPR